MKIDHCCRGFESKNKKSEQNSYEIAEDLKEWPSGRLVSCHFVCVIIGLLVI